MIKELFFEKQEPEVYKKQWSFEPEWTLTGLNTPVCVQLLIDKPTYTIGKSENNDAVLGFNRTISGRHITINCSEQGCFVTDENSTNGTMVNGRQLDPGQPVQVKSGDKLQLATSHFLVEKLR